MSISGSSLLDVRQNSSLASSSHMLDQVFSSFGGVGRGPGVMDVGDLDLRDISFINILLGTSGVWVGVVVVFISRNVFFDDR